MLDFLQKKKNLTKKKNGIGATIRIGQEIQCLPYGDFLDLTCLFSGDVLQQKKNWIIKLNHQNDSVVKQKNKYINIGKF